MPYLNIQTNRQIGAEKTETLLKTLSQGVAEILGKSENYVMIALESGKPMIFAGNDTPCAYIELKSLGLPEDETARFSTSLCELIEHQTSVSKDRIYIEFANPERHMWGWNGKTF